jgi:transposase
MAAARAMPLVCVQPLVTSWSGRTEDLMSDKTDQKDAVLIARLTAQLRCHAPEPVDETRARPELTELAGSDGWVHND